MQTFVDVQGGQLLQSGSALTPLGTLKLGETSIDTSFAVQLLARTGLVSSPVTPMAIPAGFSQLLISGRPQTDLEESTDLFDCTAFASSGSGSTQNYVGTLNLNLSALISAMAGLHTLPCYMDVWLQNEDASAKLPLVLSANVIIYRAMWRGNEADPTGPDPSYPGKQFVPTCMKSITGLTGGGSANLDGIATSTGTAPFVVILFIGGGVPRMWELVAGTASSNPSGGIVLPADYNAGTNAQFWRAMF